MTAFRQVITKISLQFYVEVTEGFYGIICLSENARCNIMLHTMTLAGIFPWELGSSFAFLIPYLIFLLVRCWKYISWGSSDHRFFLQSSTIYPCDNQQYKSVKNCRAVRPCLVFQSLTIFACCTHAAHLQTFLLL